MQLAVIGFVGLCGVLKRDSDNVPGWLEILAGILVLAALVLSCLATYLVGRAAWPLYGAKDRSRAPDDAGELERTSHRLTRGLALTFLAVALLALASAASWWPSGGDGSAESVEVQAQGQSWCGRLGDAPSGAVTVLTGGQSIQVPIETLTAVRSVASC